MAVPITSAMQNSIANLYISILGRNPEPAGFKYWVDVLANNNNTTAALQNITLDFSKAPEFNAIYGGQPTTTAIGLMYVNVLGRTADAPGLAYWSGIADAYIAQGFTIAQAYALTGNALIVGAASNTGSIDQTNIAAKQVAAVASGVASPTTTYTLTTNSPETIIAQGANTVVNGLIGTNATLQSFDTVTGTGTTTFNLADNTGGAFPGIPVAATISGFGTVNLARSGAAAASNAVTIDNTTFGTGVKALNLSNAGNLTTAAGVDITLASASSVSVANSAATAYTTVAVTDTATTVTTGSTLTTVSITGSSGNGTLTGNGITTVNLNAAATGGTVTVTAAAATRALTVNVSGTTNSGAVTDAQATTVTLNQSAAAVMGTLTVAKATTVSINTTGTATTAGAETLSAAAMTTLNIGGTRANTVTRSDYSALTSIVVTGTGGVTLGDLSAVTTLTSVNTSGASNVASASSASNLTVANSVTIGTLVSFTGGTGSDTVTVGATARAINLGTGSNTVNLIDATTAIGTGGSITGDGNDTLAFVTAANAGTVSAGSASAIAAWKAAVTGFSTVQVAAVGATTLALDVNNLGNAGVINQINLTGNAAASDITISNLGSGATIRVSGANTGAKATTAGTTGSGTNDVLNLSLTQATGTAVAFGEFVTPNIENINFIMADTQATPTGTYNTATLTNTAVNTINVSGNNGLDLGTVTGATNLQTFNASGLTLGGVRVTSAASQYASTVTGSQKGGDTLNFGAALAAVTATTTAGTNIVTGSNTVASTFTGGTGADTFFGGTGADTINLGGGADFSYGNNAGTKAVAKFTITAAATTIAADIINATIVLNLFGTDVTATFAAADITATLQADKITAAINASSLNKFVVASNVAGAITLDSTVDGNSFGITVGTTGTATGVTIKSGGTAVNTAMTLTDGVDTGTAVQTVSTTAAAIAELLAGSVAGTLGATGADVITGGAGADTFIIGLSSASPTATALQTITDFNGGAVTDFVSYIPTAVALAATVATAVSGTAAISSSGIATFVTSDQVSLAAQLTAVASAIAANTTTQGESVAFQFGSDAYMFISNGTDGVNSGDVLVKLTGVSLTNTSTDLLIASGHTLTLG